MHSSSRSGREADISAHNGPEWNASGHIYISPQANQPSSRAALAAAGAAAVIGAVLAGLIAAVPSVKAAGLIPVLIVIALLILIPACLFFQRQLRIFTLHDPSRQITGYSYNLELGQLRKGAIDHWALRVEAMHTIFDNLIALIPDAQRKQTLYELGYKVGETWTRDFLKEYALVGYGTVSESYPALFEQWSYYDATAGFGRFTFAVSHKQPKGSVLLYNSVLSRSRSSFPLNHYFSGYIAGTINTLWASERTLRGKQVVVELCEPSVQAEKIVTFDVHVTS